MTDVLSTNQNLDVMSYWPGNAPEKEDPTWKRGGSNKGDLLKRYRTCIRTSANWRKQEGYEKTWGRLVDLYRNKHFPSGINEEDRIAINISFSTINVIVPAVAVNHPQITVNAQQPQMETQAMTVEAMVNYWWRVHNWRKEVKRAVKDALVVGHGWVKVGWKYKEKQVPIQPDQAQEMFEQKDKEAGDYAEQNPHMAHTVPSPQDIAQQIPTHEAQPDVDEPFVERVSFKDILVDPEAMAEEDITWLAQRIVRPLKEVQADQSYNRNARKSIKADMGTNPRWRDKVDEKDKQSYSDDVKRCTLWEYYDLKAGYYCVFSESGDDFLLDPTETPYPYTNPFVFLPDYDVPDQFYPIGELEALEPIQLELNGVRSDMMNHRKRWQRKYLGKREYIDDEAQHALESDVDGAIAFIDANDVDLNSIFVPVPQIPLDSSMYQYSDLIEADADLVTGVSEYQRGTASETRRTATEASIIQDAANARSAEKLAQVEDFMKEIARRVVQLAQVKVTKEEVARIVSPEGAMTWVPFDREAIQGEYDFEVEAGSTQPKNEQFRRQQAVQLASTMAPFVQMGVVNPMMLAATLLRDGFGIKNPEQYIQMPPPPQAVDAQGNPIATEDPNAPPQDGATSPAEGQAIPAPGPNTPPAVLAQAKQLQGQVGLDTGAP